MSNVVKIRVQIAGQTPRDVALGAFSQMAAKRVFGLDAARAGDPDVVLYGVWIELEGPRPKAEKSLDVEDSGHPFNKWLQTVESYELAGAAEDEDDDEDPTPAEPSGSSLVSPPTSE